MPHSQSGDRVAHNWLASIPGIYFHFSGNKFIYRIAKRKHSSPIQSALKRSRSAPDKENEATTSRGERTSRAVRFSDQQSSTSASNERSRPRQQQQQLNDSAAKSTNRSKSENRTKMLMVIKQLKEKFN
jgi:hypothetical protein